MKRLPPYAFSLALAGITPTLLSAQARAQDTSGSTLPTIEVTAPGKSDTYRARSANVAGFGEQTLRDIPASVAVVTEAQLKDQQARLLSDVIKNDASIGENYAPVGYYENISVRGFALDLASGYQVNGMTVTGEQNIALENKESVEFLKGLAALQGGVSTPGGLVNYVTKRPADVRSIMFGTDSHGSRYSAVDVGTLFGEQKQFGLRINAAHEDINSYVNYSNGRREFAALAASWEISPKASLQLNADYQNKVQRSVLGYQLLDGKTIPVNVSPTTMLTPQSWAKPVTINSVNLGARLDITLSDDWKAYIAASRSRSVIDDNVVFAYGSAGKPFFGANGDFDVYDYRSPNDERRNDQLQAVLQGSLKTGAVRHELTLGSSLFRRIVDQADQNPDTSIGSGNIYNPTTLSPSSKQPTAAYRHLDSRQKSLFVTDRLHLNEQWQIIAGGRQIWLKEQAYNISGTVTRNTERSLLLPQLALLYQPQTNLTLYTSYSESLSLGGQAPSWSSVNNASAILPPTVSHQVEVGAKYDWTPDLSLTAALFRMRKAYEYPQPSADGNRFTYVQQGSQTHTGIELGASGKLTSQLRVSASVAAIQARADGTGTANYDGQQAINVPRLRSAVYADYAVAAVEGLNLQASWLYSGSKAATRDGSVSVPAYHLFNAGLRYKTMVGGHTATLRLTVDNLFNKLYWKDTGEYLGDGYLHLGAPRLARLSVQYDF